LVGFSIRHLGVSKVRGRFWRFDVDVVIGETLEAAQVSANIDVASIDTDNPDRDAGGPSRMSPPACDNLAS
jgi:polyisoprenoid-binding protein YceI